MVGKNLILRAHQLTIKLQIGGKEQPTGRHKEMITMSSKGVIFIDKASLPGV